MLFQGLHVLRVALATLVEQMQQGATVNLEVRQQL